MHDLATRAEALRALHRPGTPLVLRNAWDAASAEALVADAPALATTSVGLAQSLGYEDGGHIPADEAFAALARIVAAVDVPVTADCEAGYGLDPHAFVAGLLGAGAVGCNLEDTDHATGALRDPSENAAFLAAVKQAGRAAGVDLVLNARVDVHVRAGTLEDGLVRARAYREAGADCVYPIFCHEEEGIAAYVEAAGIINVAVHPSAPTLARMAELRVARARLGGGRLPPGELRRRPLRGGDEGGRELRAVDGAQPDPHEGVDQVAGGERLGLDEVLVHRALGHPAQREGGRLRVLGDGPAGLVLELDAPAAGVDEAPEHAAPELRDLLVVGRDLDDRPQQDAVRGIERRDVGQRLAHLGLGLAGAGEPDVGLLVEQLVDLLGEAHEQLALVAEVEVERGARDARARGDPFDVQVGVRRALGQQCLGRREHGGLDRRALGAGGRLLSGLHGRHHHPAYPAGGRSRGP